MEIRTDTWHCKAYLYSCTARRPYLEAGQIIMYSKPSLCRYFWTVAFSPMIWLLYAIGRIFFGTPTRTSLSLTALILSPLLIKSFQGEYVKVLLLCASFFVALVGAFAFKEFVIDRNFPSETRKLFKEYIKAKKSKVCPIIEFTKPTSV